MKTVQAAYNDKYYDNEYVIFPFGLSNTGATCWMNSIMQALFSLPSFNETVLELQAECLISPLSAHYASIMSAWKSGNGNSQLFKNAGSIMSTLLAAESKKSRSKLLLGGNQECANEGFIRMIDLINIPKIKNLFATSYQISVKCTKCSHVHVFDRDAGLHIEVFEPVNSLITEGAFRQYIGAHTSLTDLYTCVKCGVPNYAINREHRLKRLGECVVVLFNKYYTKENIWFPEKMSFPSQGGRRNYKLCAKIEHAGSLDGGHYWATVLRNNKWHCLNDDHEGPGHPNPTINTTMAIYHLCRD